MHHFVILIDYTITKKPEVHLTCWVVTPMKGSCGVSCRRYYGFAAASSIAALLQTTSDEAMARQTIFVVPYAHGKQSISQTLTLMVLDAYSLQMDS